MTLPNSSDQPNVYTRICRFSCFALAAVLTDLLVRRDVSTTQSTQSSGIDLCDLITIAAGAGKLRWQSLQRLMRQDLLARARELLLRNGIHIFSYRSWAVAPVSE